MNVGKSRWVARRKSKNLFFATLRVPKAGNNPQPDAVRSDIQQLVKDHSRIWQNVDISIGSQDRGGSREAGHFA